MPGWLSPLSVCLQPRHDLGVLKLSPNLAPYSNPPPAHAHVLALSLSFKKLILFFSFFLFLRYLFIWEREWERERENMREGRVRRRRLPSEQGAHLWDSILGPQDHDMSQRQSLNQLSHQGTTQQYCSNRIKGNKGMIRISFFSFQMTWERGWSLWS